MKNNAQELEKYRKISDEIDNLGIETEVAKKQIIDILKQDSHDDFTEKAEHFLELLLHTEKVIEVLRHDFNELAIFSSWNDSEKGMKTWIERFQMIEKDILRTAKLVEGVRIAITSH